MTFTIAARRGMEAAGLAYNLGRRGAFKLPGNCDAEC